MLWPLEIWGDVNQALAYDSGLTNRDNLILPYGAVVTLRRLPDLGSIEDEQ